MAYLSRLTTTSRFAASTARQLTQHSKLSGVNLATTALQGQITAYNSIKNTAPVCRLRNYSTNPKDSWATKITATLTEITQAAAQLITTDKKHEPSILSSEITQTGQAVVTRPGTLRVGNLVDCVGEAKFHILQSFAPQKIALEKIQLTNEPDKIFSLSDDQLKNITDELTKNGLSADQPIPVFQLANGSYIPAFISGFEQIAAMKALGLTQANIFIVPDLSLAPESLAKIPAGVKAQLKAEHIDPRTLLRDIDIEKLKKYMSSTAVELIEQLSTGKITSEECLKYSSALIQLFNPVLGAFSVEFNPTVKSSLTGPLHGLPISIKGSSWLKGHPPIMGSRLSLRLFPSGAAVRAVEEIAVRTGVTSYLANNLIKAGAQGVGFTSTTEFSLRPNPHAEFGPSAKSIYPLTHNKPGERTRSAGGSSSRSGVAVSAGITPVALGVEVGGSSKTPAAMNGVITFCPANFDQHNKTTTHTKQLHDVLRHIVFSRSIEDIATIQAIQSGHSIEEYLAQIKQPAKPVRLAQLNMGVFAGQPKAENCQIVMLSQASLLLQKQGHTVESLPRETFPSLLKNTIYQIVQSFGPTIVAAGVHKLLTSIETMTGMPIREDEIELFSYAMGTIGKYQSKKQLEDAAYFINNFHTEFYQELTRAGFNGLLIPNFLTKPDIIFDAPRFSKPEAAEIKALLKNPKENLVQLKDRVTINYLEASSNNFKLLNTFIGNAAGANNAAILSMPIGTKEVVEAGGMPLSFQILMPPKPNVDMQLLQIAHSIQHGAQFQPRLKEAQQKLLEEVLASGEA